MGWGKISFMEWYIVCLLKQYMLKMYHTSYQDIVLNISTGKLRVPIISDTLKISSSIYHVNALSQRTFETLLMSNVHSGTIVYYKLDFVYNDSKTFPFLHSKIVKLINTGECWNVPGEVEINCWAEIYLNPIVLVLSDCFSLIRIPAW